MRNRFFSLLTAFLAIPLCFSLFLSSVPAIAETSNETTVSSEEGSADEEETPLPDPVNEEDMTSEMVEDGWVVIDSQAYPPETIGLNAQEMDQAVYDYYANSDVMPVTFHVNVPGDLNLPIYLYYTDDASYQEYYIDLYPSAGYSKTILMPVGFYYLTGGGPESDVMSHFFVESPKNFAVVKDQRNNVAVTLGNYRNAATQIVEGNQDTDQEETIDVTTETIEEGKEEESAQAKQQTPWYRYAIAAFVLLGISAASLLAYIKIIRYERD